MKIKIIISYNNPNTKVLLPSLRILKT